MHFVLCSCFLAQSVSFKLICISLINCKNVLRLAHKQARNQRISYYPCGYSTAFLSYVNHFMSSGQLKHDGTSFSFWFYMNRVCPMPHDEQLIMPVLVSHHRLLVHVPTYDPMYIWIMYIRTPLCCLVPFYSLINSVIHKTL